MSNATQAMPDRFVRGFQTIPKYFTDFLSMALHSAGISVIDAGDSPGRVNDIGTTPQRYSSCIYAHLYLTNCMFQIFPHYVQLGLTLTWVIGKQLCI